MEKTIYYYKAKENPKGMRLWAIDQPLFDDDPNIERITEQEYESLLTRNTQSSSD